MIAISIWGSMLEYWPGPSSLCLVKGSGPARLVSSFQKAHCPFVFIEAVLKQLFSCWAIKVKKDILDILFSSLLVIYHYSQSYTVVLHCSCQGSQPLCFLRSCQVQVQNAIHCSAHWWHEHRDGALSMNPHTYTWFILICLNQWHIRCVNSVWHLQLPTGVCPFSSISNPSIMLKSDLFAGLW